MRLVQDLNIETRFLCVSPDLISPIHTSSLLSSFLVYTPNDVCLMVHDLWKKM